MSASPESLRSHAASRRLPGAGRVLVVEDDSTIRETLEVLIAIEGCEARTSGDPVRALELAREWQPDLILLDYSLPGMSGAEVIQAYHQTPPPHAPIILMTGRTIDASEAAAMGAAGVLPKPFEVTDLLDVVASFTDCADT